ncbi:MAG: lipid A export permease/ATP-binding protein MsbA [Gammaproteobacteria bacterium]|nr:lipid A export permease/ATP-binding protein MsbA [Gammaproteobacteria bacterium]
MMPGKKPISSNAAYRRLLGYTKGFRRFFLYAFVGMAIYSIAEMQMARFVQVLIDDVFVSKDQAVIRSILLMLVLIVLGRSFGHLIQIYCMSAVSRGVIMTLRRDMFGKLLILPHRFYDKSSSGEIISSFSFNVEQIAESITNAITTIIQDSILIVFLIGLMVYTNAKLSVVLFVLLPLAAIIIYGVSSRFRKYSRRIQQTIGHVTHIVNEAVDGHQVIKIFGGEKQERKKFLTANQHNYQQNMRLTLTRSMTGAMVQLVAGAALIGVIYLSVSGWVGEVSPGDFSLFLVAMARMAPPLKHWTALNVQMQRGIAAAISIFELLDEEHEHDPGVIKLNRAKGNIEFKNVSFTYDESKGSVLKNLNFKIKSGDTVALVGRSGSGKSTIAKLLPRFYEVEEGQILLDNRNLNEYSLQDLRNQIAYVGQNVTLFNDTIANNIAYGRLGSTSREQIVAAAEAANAMDFISKLPDSLDTIVGEDGVLLSGGQRQRLAIARALLKDSPILILDEATSALDTESEKLIQGAIDNLVKNRTTIVIAHRLSTVEKADRILVLDNGSIVESGSHDELLKKDEQYASLYKLQFNTGDTSEPRVAEVEKSDIINFPIAGQDFLAVKPQSTSWEHLWYGYHPLAQLLAPIGYLFNMIVSFRRFLYRLGFFRSRRFKVPVIVVGNVTVGGTGKTPLVIWLANHLKARGYKPGIISRGYKGRSKVWPLVVTAETSAEIAGDEAAMIVARTNCPVVIGPDRKRDVGLLLDKYNCDIVISDDGLQHYALKRDIEIVVADGARGFGNGMMLPAGPMREPKSRLKEVDYIITNGARLPGSYPMTVSGGDLIAFNNISREAIKEWKGRTVHAVAAIGNPERFFNSLRDAGLQVIEHRFEDHYGFTKKDIIFNDNLAVVMTEKDAVKCKPLLDDDKAQRYWYLPVAANVTEEFTIKLDEHIEKLLNAKKAA